MTDNGTQTVVKEPTSYNDINFGSIVIALAGYADEFYAWGEAPAARDKQLRAFWPTEPVLASALFTTVSRYAGFGWQLNGPDRTSNIVKRMFHNSDHGEGWLPFITKILIDLFSQDNGAFIEVLRAQDSETSAVVQLNHLDSNRCIRTGKHDAPVIYVDREGWMHLLKWYQVITLEEFPSPIEEARGMQYCTVTRMLKAAQILRDISTYKKEKVSGRFTRALHLVGGIQKRAIDDALRDQNLAATAQNLTRYIQPVVVAALDPNARVSHETLELASLPDHFDEEVTMRWYINQLALAFGGDYQDFSPLPGGNLGTAQQSATLHMKSRGKGPKLFMTMLEHKFNSHGVMPNTVTFFYGDQDIQEDMQKAQLQTERARGRAERIRSGEITPAVARQLAVDVGDLDQKYAEALEKYDIEQTNLANQQAAQRPSIGADGKPLPVTAPPKPAPVQDLTPNVTVQD